MSWLKLDDNFADHPKVLGLSDAAFRVHIKALCYCARHLTDGIIPGAKVVGREKEAEELLAAKLWHRRGVNYEVNDFLLYNPTREEELARREHISAARSVAGKAGNQSRWAGQKPVANGIANGSQTDRKAIARTRTRIKSSLNPNSSPNSEGERALSARRAPARSEFVKPTREDVVGYFKAASLLGDPEAFYDTFENQDWRLSAGTGAVMKDWRLTAKNWSRREKVMARPGGNGRVLKTQRDIETENEAAQISRNREAQERARLAAADEERNLSAELQRRYDEKHRSKEAPHV